MNQQRLRQAGRADDQAVAADEQRHEDLVHHLVLPDDDLLQLADDRLPARLHPIRKRDIVRRQINDVGHRV